MTVHQERRRFFRITDQVLLSYRTLSACQDGQEEAHRPVDLRRAQVQQALHQVEEKLSQKMVRLHAESPELAEILALLNTRINLIAGEEEPETGQLEKQATDVNISACGIAFPAQEALAIGTLLVMDLTLTLSYTTLSLTAQVVGVEALTPGDGMNEQYTAWIRADFVDISEVDQELLVQHVLKRQSEQLKALREARERKGSAEKQTPTS